MDRSSLSSEKHFGMKVIAVFLLIVLGSSGRAEAETSSAEGSVDRKLEEPNVDEASKGKSREKKTEDNERNGESKSVEVETTQKTEETGSPGAKDNEEGAQGKEAEEKSGSEEKKKNNEDDSKKMENKETPQKEAKGDTPATKEKKENPCELTSDAGNCSDSFNRYYYNKVTMQCEMFTYGGCGGNANNFKIKVTCERRCSVKKTPQAAGNVCNMTKDAGTCTKRIRKWYFDGEKMVCKQFNYGGCGGNTNRFDSREECRQRCIATLPAKVICGLPPANGTCKGRDKRWFYDTEKKACKLFIYTGCDGNPNNFGSLAECNRKCAFV